LERTHAILPIFLKGVWPLALYGVRASKFLAKGVAALVKGDEAKGACENWIWLGGLKLGKGDPELLLRPGEDGRKLDVETELLWNIEGVVFVWVFEAAPVVC
jgi:hypothetical protein